jgi:methyl-accepting chemotaxis protein
MAGALNRAGAILGESVAVLGQNAQVLATSSEELAVVAKRLSTDADETANQAHHVSTASSQVCANVNTVATGIEEMNASIKEVAKNAHDAAKVATTAVKVTEATHLTMEKLGASSSEIGNVIKVITSIAEQTNLLSLNATIEAARAGDAGRGFAVVANEVKELARETSKATEEISEKIAAIQADARGAMDAIREISKIIAQINDIQNTIATSVEEQTVTTSEIGRNAAEAAFGSNQIAQSILCLAETAKSATAGASNTRKAAGELARLSSELTTTISQFKL